MIRNQSTWLQLQEGSSRLRTIRVMDIVCSSWVSKSSALKSQMREEWQRSLTPIFLCNSRCRTGWTAWNVTPACFPISLLLPQLTTNSSNCGPTKPQQANLMASCFWIKRYLSVAHPSQSQRVRAWYMFLPSPSLKSTIIRVSYSTPLRSKITPASQYGKRWLYSAQKKATSCWSTLATGLSSIVLLALWSHKSTPSVTSLQTMKVFVSVRWSSASNTSSSHLKTGRQSKFTTNLLRLLCTKNGFQRSQKPKLCTSWSRTH